LDVQQFSAKYSQTIVSNLLRFPLESKKTKYQFTIFLRRWQTHFLCICYV